MRWLIITLALAIIGFSAVFVYLAIRIKQKIVVRNATIIFYFNLENKTFRLLKTSRFNFVLPFLIKKDVSKYSDRFYPISNLDKFFENDAIMKKIRGAYYELQNSNIENKKIQHLWRLANRQSFITFEFNKTEEMKGIGKFVWRTKKDTIHGTPINKSFNRFIYQNKESPNVNMYAIKSINNIDNSFFPLIASEIYANLPGTTHFVKNRGVLYFVICSKSQKSLDKNHSLLIKLLNHRAKVNYLKHVSFIGYIPIGKDVSTSAELLQSQRKLDYILYKLRSKQGKSDGQIHFYLFSDVFSKDDFDEFNSASSIFNNILKTDGVKGRLIKIYNTKTTKSSGNILFPYIGHSMSQKAKKMIYTKWAEYSLINFLVQQLNSTSKVTYQRGSIVEVNYDWLMKNYLSIVNKNYLYSISFPNIENLKSALSILEFFTKETNIKYGIKITPDLLIDRNLLRKIGLSFVVIGENLALNLYKRKEFSKVLLINKIFENTKLKIIYINPSPKLDDIQRAELKIKYAVFPK